MDFATLPPEVNSARMYAGPGSRSMLAAASAWDGLATDLQSTAASYQSVITELTGGPWAGPSSLSMVAAVMPYVQWLTTMSGHAEQVAIQSKQAVAAYESAFAMTVPPPVVASNRSLLMALIATNIVGQNTMAIAATEADYAEMWAQDASAMYSYAGSSAAASTLTPFPSPPSTTNPAGLTNQAAATAQSVTSNGPQVMSGVTQALQGLSSGSAAADPSSTLLTVLTAIIIPLTAADLPIATASATASTTSATASFTSAGTTYRGLLINADRDFGAGKGPYTGYGPGAAMLPEWILGGPNALAESGSAPTLSAAAGLGQATTVGRLSVPSTWATAAPEYRPAAYSIPLESVGAAPEMAASNGWLGDMALAGAAGRMVGGTAPERRRDQRVRFAHHGPAQQQPAHGESVTEMASQVREIAALAQSLLTKLVDSGVMTDDEVAEQKRRFRW